MDEEFLLRRCSDRLATRRASDPVWKCEFMGRQSLSRTSCFLDVEYNYVVEWLRLLVATGVWIVAVFTMK